MRRKADEEGKGEGRAPRLASPLRAYMRPLGEGVEPAISRTNSSTATPREAPRAALLRDSSSPARPAPVPAPAPLPSSAPPPAEVVLGPHGSLAMKRKSENKIHQ